MNKIKILTLLLLLGSTVTTRAQEPTIEQTLVYLNANILDLNGIEQWSGWDKIEYQKNIITITFICSEGCPSTSYPVVFEVNMNKEYEIRESESQITISFKSENIRCKRADGQQFTRNVFCFSNAESKTVKAMKHLLKLAYKDRDKTFDNLKF